MYCNAVLECWLDVADIEGTGVTTLKLLKALFFTDWRDYLDGFVCVHVHCGSYVGPYLIDTFVQYLSGQREFKSEGSNPFMPVEAEDQRGDHQLWLSMREGRDFCWYMHDTWTMALQVVLAMVLYKNLGAATFAALSQYLSCRGSFCLRFWVRKVEEGWLKRSDVSKQSQTSGEIINYMAVDAERVATFAAFCHNNTCHVGEHSFGELEENFQEKLMESKDKRMKATYETLRNMRILNFRGGKKFLSKILGIVSYLQLDDLQPDVMEKLPRGSSNIVIEIVDGNFSWDLSSPTPTLKDLNLKVFHSTRVAVCAYSPVALDTECKIEDNILFGKEMKRERFMKHYHYKVQLLLLSGSDFKELVGAHEKALSALDHTIEAGSVSEKCVSEPDGVIREMQKEGNEIGEVDDVGPKGQLVEEEEREKGKVGFRSTGSITTAYGGALIPFILLAQILFQVFQIGSNYWMAWASPAIEPPASTYQSVVDLNIPSQVAGVAVSVSTPWNHCCHVSGCLADLYHFYTCDVACIWYQQYYISSARELARLIEVCKAPIIQNFFETISGATTIMGFDQESRFQQKNMILMDAYSRPKFHANGAMQWLCFSLDMLCSITFAFSLFFLISIPDGIINSGIAGLAVTFGLNLNMSLSMLVWQIFRMEKIISVERILQYSSIPSEPSLVIESNCPDLSWPFRGEVCIHDLQVRYAPHMPLVLRGLTCTFPGGLKTGIVGRTGSGKTTLLQTLFRIVEPAAGRIIIDGVNISSIGLHDLRLRLSIIPQDPTMFEGTIRSNLVPLEEYTDEQIWEALNKCQLGDKLERRKASSSLQLVKTERIGVWVKGSCCVLGVCCSRKSKILVLEATASVDTATDNLIQTTLKEHFSECTVITIAHRVTSVVDSDMVMLLSQGVIEEYDSVGSLLENKFSSFAQLVAEYT
ncbi:ABC transporter C family member 7 [Hibiscus syriacus]|uniref:ABC-type xenobiotic transporter n=1 Tax=Hibiscus syriacus TaxID=106335 RepID=A0A6A3A550_HIBSY|nr:ABC transporter C family member 7 [Hibiscus syriacus]